MKKYKKEYIEKVKFHDIQSSNKRDNGVAAESCNDKDSKNRSSSGVANEGNAARISTSLFLD